MEQAARRTHADSSICLEGTQRLPGRFRACCEAFDAATRRCQFDIRFEWWAHYRAWFVLQPPGTGGGGIRMRYCPFCGTRLQGVGPPGGRWLQPELLED